MRPFADPGPKGPAIGPGNAEAEAEAKTEPTEDEAEAELIDAGITGSSSSSSSRRTDEDEGEEAAEHDADGPGWAGNNGRLKLLGGPKRFGNVVMVHCSSKSMLGSDNGEISEVPALSRPQGQSEQRRTSMHRGTLLRQRRSTCFRYDSSRMHCKREKARLSFRTFHFQAKWKIASLPNG